MGCCCSKKAEEPHQVSKNAPPPPPPPEEEMVKEVLSETPKPKPKPKSLPPHSDLKKLNANELSKSNRLDSEAPEKKKNPVVPRLVDDRSEQPQPSDEACSFSEAASVATLTSISSSMATRERDEEETFTSSSLPNNKIHRTSHYNSNGNGNSRRASQLQSFSGELGGGVKKESRSSPAVVVSGAGCRSARASPTPTRSNNNRSLSRDRSGIKRDIGERSARRSVSPGAKRRDVAGAPARRVPPAPPNKAAPATQEVGQEGKESLDNPSVSLECFIFL